MESFNIYGISKKKIVVEYFTVYISYSLYIQIRYFKSFLKVSCVKFSLRLLNKILINHYLNIFSFLEIIFTTPIFLILIICTKHKKFQTHSFKESIHEGRNCSEWTMILSCEIVEYSKIQERNLSDVHNKNFR